MSPNFPIRVLLVDNDPAVLTALRAILTAKGCNVRTAEDGFAALKLLRETLPDIIICDLRMEGMSGFELCAIVRRRFPHIGVIVISGEFVSDGMPGMLVDLFLEKGRYTVDELLKAMADLASDSPVRPHLAKPIKAPLWIPRREVGYIVATCTDCLRSFSVDDASTNGELRTTECPSCETEVEYLVDASVLRMLAQRKERISA